LEGQAGDEPRAHPGAPAALAPGSAPVYRDAARRVATAAGAVARPAAQERSMRTASALPTPQRLARRELLLGAFTMAMAVVGLASLAAVALGGGLGWPGAGAGSDGDDRPSLVAVGTGRATAPAEVAHLQLLLGPATFDGQFVPGGGAPDAEPGEAEAEAVEPIVRAIAETGVPEEAVRVVVSAAYADRFYGPVAAPNGVRIDVTVRRPSAEKINALVNAAAVAAAAGGQALTRIGAAYAVGDCAALERDARLRAIEDARASARQQADLLAVPLGDLILSRDGEPSDDPAPHDADATADCFQADDPPPTAADPFVPTDGITLPPFDPTAPAEAVVTVQVSLTFALPGD
jgi:uncharacterized protein YggE